MGSPFLRGVPSFDLEVHGAGGSPAGCNRLGRGPEIQVGLGGVV